MPTQLSRMTFAVPLEMEKCLDELKRNRFYKQSYSEMIRTLIELGMKHLNENPSAA